MVYLIKLVSVNSIQFFVSKLNSLGGQKKIATGPPLRGEGGQGVMKMALESAMDHGRVLRSCDAAIRSFSEFVRDAQNTSTLRRQGIGPLLRTGVLPRKHWFE